MRASDFFLIHLRATTAEDAALFDHAGWLSAVVRVENPPSTLLADAGLFVALCRDWTTHERAVESFTKNGGLKSATRRLLRSVADDAGTRRPIATHAERRIEAGAVLIREWHGTEHQVTALKDGFKFRGKRYQSLSKIAGEITGTRWSGRGAGCLGQD